MEKIFINKASGDRLSALLFHPSQPAHCAVIICHGFRGRKENSGKIFGFAELLNEMNLLVIAFDFSGSGESSGDFSRINLKSQGEDLRVVMDYVTEKFGLPMVLLGRSFGGSTILAGAAGDYRIRAWVLWSTPVKMQDTFSKIMPEEYQRLQNGDTVVLQDESGQYALQPLLVKDFDNHYMEKQLSLIKAQPVLIIHGENDEVVDPGDALYIKEHLDNAELFIVAGANHRFEDKIREREELTINWLKKVL